MVEILLLLATVIVIGPLVRFTKPGKQEPPDFDLITSPSFNPGIMR